MTNRTNAQIEAMKTQTFGVEVEMNNITRSKAAEVAAKYFGTFNYRNTQSEDGYYTWSAYDAQGRKWKFSRDVSIAGPDEEKCEMVTPVLKYEDMELLQGLIRELRKAGAKSNPQRGCGIHIHVGGDGHTPKTIRNLVNIMKRRESFLTKAVRIDSYRMNTYCKPVDEKFFKEVNRVKPNTVDKLAEVWYTTQGSFRNSGHYDHTRYHMLNLHAFFNRYHTIEFRLFQFDNPTDDKKGGLHAGQLKAMIQLCLAMSQLAKSTSYVTTKQCDTTDESKSMRIWFGRLGLVGDEFKVCRNYFTRNLTANSERA